MGQRDWTFGQKVGAGFAAMVAVVLMLAGGGIYALNRVVAAKDKVITGDARILIAAANLRAATEWKSSATRGYLLAGQQSTVDDYRAARQELLGHLQALRVGALDAESRRLVSVIERTEAAHHTLCQELIGLRQQGGTTDATGRAFQERVLPQIKELRQHVAAFVQHQERLLEQGTRDASKNAEQAVTGLGALAALAVLLATIIAVALTRTLGRQIGSAVQHVESSSAELQAAANQQASGAREQATAMAEITTTINELLTTSRQISESAQRVTQIAEDTARSARAGEQTVVRTGDSIGAIKRQVDLIVSHMLDLGKKSQQIGGIVEIITELAEQTNILAINATIEAAGAGESGRRFAVVADEIRKLADRVGGSTREIRELIDQIRTAVNTTVMTTEAGTKVVDAGVRQFDEVATSLKEVAASVRTTTEAAREIELSTKQQSTAVAQVNVAIANVAQATRETEASASQTLQTASQLTHLSRDLMRLIRPRAST